MILGIKWFLKKTEVNQIEWDIITECKKIIKYSIYISYSEKTISVLYYYYQITEICITLTWKIPKHLNKKKKQKNYQIKSL